MGYVEPRFEMDQPVQFRLSSDSEWRSGRTRNVSRSGMLFSSDLCPEVGSAIEVRLLQADEEGTIRLIGPSCLAIVVRRVLKNGPGDSHLIGVRFTERESAPSDPTHDSNEMCHEHA